MASPPFTLISSLFTVEEEQRSLGLWFCLPPEKSWWQVSTALIKLCNPTPCHITKIADLKSQTPVWLHCAMLKMRADENWIKLRVAAHGGEVIRDKHWDAEADLSCWRLSEIGAVSPSVPVARWLEFPNVGLMGCQPGAEPLHRTSHNNKWSKIKPD